AVAIARVERIEGDDDSSLDRDILGAGPNLRLNFGTGGPVVPFVDAAFGLYSVSVKAEDSAGQTTLDEDDTGIFVQASVGARFFVADGASINLAARYRRIQLDDELGGDIDQYGLLAGLSVFF
ncbi:MAG: outer membrane beta-barrel protein, partial [Planctomycetota bacterium]